jgi:hypothetical protein
MNLITEAPYPPIPAAVTREGRILDKAKPPFPPPILRRNTTIEIEKQIDETLSSRYENRLLYDNEVLTSQIGLKQHHYYFLNPPEGSERDTLHIKEIMKELSKTLPKQLEINARGSMFVRFDESSPQYIRAILTGVEGTPYSSGIFLFDVFLPADYPHVPCLCRHVTPNANVVHANNGPGGFSPNLHSGKQSNTLTIILYCN